ncbi:hypothetical protein V494_05301 [Pseudogymnoascus sp. VKM F-4513 (FW-928)]|nr:hypothetical protein V494_05301 [Pseudogymnoascus sp. VKM F-4513 (FW-928)]
MENHSLDTTVIDETLVASISRILVESNIPCVLWGNYLLAIYGVPSIVDVSSSSTVIRGVCASNKGLADCSELELCTAVVKTRTSPPPAVHFHIDAEMTVSIYTQYSTLWFLPELILNKITHSPDFILASDSRLPPPRPGRGRGAFHASPFPVYIPTAHRLLEAFICLILRPPDGKYRCFAIAMVTYIGEYVDEDGLLNEEKVESRCKEFYSGLKNGRKPMRSLVEDLKAGFEGPTD